MLRSLKTRMIIFTVGFFLLLAPATAYFSLNYFKGHFKETIIRQQSAMVGRMADDLDQRLSSVQEALVRVAAQGVTPEVIASPAAAERFLDSQIALRSLFDNGIYLFSSDGRIISETNVKPPRTGADYSYRDYLKKTITDRKPYISDPYISTQLHGHPVVMFTAPVFEKGRLTAILAGSLDLLHPNFLGSLAETHIGKSGYFYLFAADRTIIVHPDRNRIFQSGVSCGVNRLFDTAVAGSDVAGETVNSSGVELLSAFRHLKRVNWGLAGNYSLQEAFAPVRTAERSAWAIIVFGGIFTAAAVWLGMGRFLAPLLALTAHIRGDAAESGNFPLPPFKRNDEVGELAAAFFSLMEKLRNEESELLRRNEILQTLSDFATDWIFLRTVSGENRYVSPACHAISGYTPAEFESDRGLFRSLILPEYREVWDRHLDRYVDEGSPCAIEFPILARDGSEHWISHVCRPVRGREGTILGVRGSNTDITDRKRTERQVARVGNLYATLSQTNKAIIRIDDQQQLFEEICRIAVECGRFRLAWVGLIDPGTGLVVPVASFGVAENYLEGLCISIHPEVPEGRGITGSAIQEGKYQINNDFNTNEAHLPWRAAAGRCGLRSSAAFPLRREGEVIGALAMYSGEADYFDEQLIELLTEMAIDISFALENFSREERRLRAEESMRLAATVFECSGEAITITDPRGVIISVNRAFTDITGYSADEVVGKTPRILKSGRHDRDFYHVMWSTILETGHWQGEMLNRRRNSEIYHEWLAVSAVKNAQGEVTNYIGISADITERKEASERIEFLAHFDALTSLPNRVLLLDQLAQAINTARRDKKRIALLFLDLDRFKTINNSLGHEAGDEVLRQVGERIGSRIQAVETAARLGGDEFMVLLTDAPDVKQVASTAQELLDTVADEEYVVGEHELKITASVGITIFPDDGDDGALLVKNAEMAMYRAKELGRNAYRFFTQDMNAFAFEHLFMENSLRRGLERREFRLHYQPQIDAVTGEVIGCEALVRWLHPDEGMVPPGTFIMLAEETGLIVPLGEWVLREACAQNRAWQEEGLPAVPVAVNLSAVQFRQKDLLETVRSVLADTGLPPHFLELEITESVAMKDAESTIKALKELKEIGVRLSIDDFGTGYSSLSYLKRFPIDKIKIDRSFVRDIISDPDDAAITGAIISMAKSLKLRVIAEGVENGEQLAFMRERGCDEIQGYYFSKPLTPVDFRLYLMDRGRR